jgi:ABC-type branched-subunit amino acid transport system ATPase component
VLPRAETAALATLIRRVVGTGATVLLVEHDMPFVMGLCDSVTVLNFGRRIFSGAPDAARRDPEVIAAYLGAKVAARLTGAAPR